LGSIHKRLLYIIENEGLSIAAFERKIGAGRNSISSALRNKSSISHSMIKNICVNYPQFSSDWIIFGKKSPHTKAIELLLKMKKLLKALNANEL
jgi:transcriptional regulator with XRE-family HTH domain